MKKILLIGAALAMLASPLLAQTQGSEESKSDVPRATTGQAPRAAQPQAAPAQRGPNDVYCGGDYVGSDPDAAVRLQMRRDFKKECE